MYTTYQNPLAIWLKTEHPVVPVNVSLWDHRAAVQTALRQGVVAIADALRPEFYEIVLGNHWYYIHIPSRIARAYLVAASEKSTANPSALVAHNRAS